MLAAPFHWCPARPVRYPLISIAVLVVVFAPSNASGGGRVSFSAKLRSGPGLQNHPVGVRPSGSIRIPQGWPLDNDGTIKCTTCHQSLPSLDGTGEPMLRDFDAGREPPTVFCGKCHDHAGADNGRGIHALAADRAHLLPVFDETRQSPGRLDPESRRCLSCHDGVTATEHVNGPTGSLMGYSGQRGRPHPVGVAYGAPRGQQRATPLRHRSLLPPEVRLPGGVVSCVSCHNIYQTSENLLSVPIEESKLCFACHEMD